MNVAPTVCGSLPPKGAVPSGKSQRDCPTSLGRPGAAAVSLTLVSTRTRGFTLLELLLVVAIIAVASAGVGFALRDSVQSSLERDAQRLAALFESARAQSRASGVAVRWRTATPDEMPGFRFEGLPVKTLPENWLSPHTSVQTPITLWLGPEPIIEPQIITLISSQQPGLSVHVSTDGLRPFAVQP